MKYDQHIKTHVGELWVIDAYENGFSRLEDESLSEFETKVLSNLTKELLGDVKINHHENGEPYLVDRPGTFISISHSDRWMVLYYSATRPVGVDLQLMMLSVEKIRDEFLTKEEQSRIQLDRDHLFIAWGAKEAIYKWRSGDFPQIKESCRIMKISNDSILVTVNRKEVTLNYRLSKNYCLVYTID